MKKNILFLFALLFSCKKNFDNSIEYLETNTQSQLNENLILNNDLIHSEEKTIIEDIIINIDGIYVDKYNSEGLKVETIADGNYKFTRIHIRNNEYIFSEYETAYVVKKSGFYPYYQYYWHTGRYDDIPGSNAIIVYNVQFKNNRIIRSYFFPEGSSYETTASTLILIGDEWIVQRRLTGL